MKLTVPECLEGSHYQSLNGLRAVSIMVVLLGHAFQYSSIKLLNSIPGTYGVSIFFVLSGFLITTLLLKERVNKGTISLKSFYKRRALRILPLLYLFLITLSVLNETLHLHVSNSSFLASFFFYRNLVPFAQENAINGHLWSLSVEEQFYIICPLLLFISLRFYIFVLFSICFFSPILWYGDAHKLFFFSVPSIHVIVEILKMQTGIAAGSLASILMFWKPSFVKRISSSGHLPLLLLFISAIFQTKGLNLFPESLVVLPQIIIALAIVLLISKNNWFVVFLNLKPVNWIGKLSYSIYIWQQLFLFKDWSGAYLVSSNIVLNFILILIISTISYYLYESQFIKLKNSSFGLSRRVNLYKLVSTD